MFALGFKARVDLLACVHHYLCAMVSSDSPLVQHLLTSWRAAWQLSRFDSHGSTCVQSWSSSPGLQVNIHLALKCKNDPFHEKLECLTGQCI